MYGAIVTCYNCHLLPGSISGVISTVSKYATLLVLSKYMNVTLYVLVNPSISTVCFLVDMRSVCQLNP